MSSWQYYLLVYLYATRPLPDMISTCYLLSRAGRADLSGAVTRAAQLQRPWLWRVSPTRFVLVSALEFCWNSSLRLRDLMDGPSSCWLPRVWVACSRRLGRRGLATAASLCLVWGLAITVMPLALTPRAALPLEAQPAVRRIHQQEDSDYSGTKVLRDDEPLRGLAPDLGAPHRAGEQQAAVPPPYASAGHEHEGSLKLDSNPSDLRLGNAVARQSNSHTGAGMSLRGAGAKSRIFAPIEPKLSPADDTGLEPEEDEEAALADGGEGRMQEDAGSPNEGPYTLPILKAPKDSKGRAGPQKPLGYLAKVGASGDVVRRSVEDAEVRDEAASHVVPFRSSRGVYSGGGGVFPMRPVQFQHKAGVGDQQALDQQVQDQQAQDQQAQKKEAQDPEEQAQMLALAAIMHGKKVTATQQQLVQQLSPTKRRKLELRTKDLQHRQEKAYLKQLRERGQVVAAEGGGELILSSPRTALRMPALLKRHQPSDWPPEYRIFLNATFSPWVDDACKSLQVRFASPHSLPTRALASFPSSGNTWLRFLIEGATGIFTGSLYDDSSLTKKGMYGEAVPHDAGITVMQKTHGYTTGDAMKVPHEQQLLKNHFEELGCRGLVIIRNPFKALISHRHLDTGGHTGFAPKSHFVGEGWAYFVALKIQLWENFYKDWLEQCPSSDIFVTHYEILKQNVRSELQDILQFFHMPVDQHRLDCLLSHSDASFKRKESRSKQYSEIFFYPWHLKCLIYNAIERLNVVLIQKGKRGLPHDRYEWYNSTEANLVRLEGCPKESDIRVP